jgi:hypothetical protein
MESPEFEQPHKDSIEPDQVKITSEPEAISDQPSSEITFENKEKKDQVAIDKVRADLGLETKKNKKSSKSQSLVGKVARRLVLGAGLLLRFVSKYPSSV